MTYQSNPMISAQSGYENKGGDGIRPKSLDISARRHSEKNSPDIIIDSVLTSVKPKKCNERESFGTIIESLSYKLALQVEVL